VDKLTDNPVVRQLQLLLNGYAYNFYDRRTQARADDLLVREKASSTLNGAAEKLSQLAADFQRERIGPATREHPFPSAELMAELDAIRRLRDEVLKVEGSIRGMPVPSDDFTWQRYRDEQALLLQLLDYDVGLIVQAGEVAQAIEALDADAWSKATRHEVQQRLKKLEKTVRERGHFLAVPQGG
jgi:hypothetical protein